MIDIHYKVRKLLEEIEQEERMELLKVLYEVLIEIYKSEKRKYYYKRFTTY